MAESRCVALVSDTPLRASAIALHFVPMVLALPFTKQVQRVIAVGTFNQVVYLTVSFHLLNEFSHFSVSLGRRGFESRLLRSAPAIASLFDLRQSLDLVV